MYYFIVNPHSKSGKGEKIWEKVEKLLNNWQIDYQCFRTEKPGDAKMFARQLTEGIKEPKIITAVGGDGTVNEILDGLSFCGPITFGYIPAGSGNDLARSLRLPKSPKKCLKKILYPKYHKQLDYGVISYGEGVIKHRRFCVSSGIGMDAAVCHNLLYSRSKTVLNKLHAGRLAYALVGAKQLLLAKSAKGYILLDGIKKVEFNHIYFIAAHIHPYEGGGFKFAPKADPSDGRLAISVASYADKKKLLPILVSAYFGQRNWGKSLKTYECKEVRIHLERPMAVHADGESCFCQDDLQIQCIEKKLRVIV